MRWSDIEIERVAATAGESAGSSARHISEFISDSAARGKEAISNSAEEAIKSVGSDLNVLKHDLESLRDTVVNYIAQTRSTSVKAAQEAASSVADQVGDAVTNLTNDGAEAISTAAGHTKTAMSELESIVRRNPVGAIAGAVLFGMIIGFAGRMR